MGIINSLLDALADRLDKRIQGRAVSQSFRDIGDKGSSFSVEAEVSESLANLMLTDFTLPVEGDSARAVELDRVASEFARTRAAAAVSLAFESGDAVIVPSWNGAGFDNVVVGAQDFAILSSVGDRITSMAYIVDRKHLDDGSDYALIQLVELVGYSAEAGEAQACRYRLFAARNGKLIDRDPGSVLPEWGEYDADWMVPAVDRLLVARYKSFTVDPRHPNGSKGVPICFGASDHIREIHYLLDQMHNEFGLSEKAIIADKRMFAKSYIKNRRTGEEEEVLQLPKGAERLFMAVKGGGGVDSTTIHDWSPDIRYQAYLEALDRQEQLVEKAVGVSSGIISSPNDMNYQNVDNVRKSQQKTIGFIKTARRVAEETFADLVYAWDVLLNYYGVTPAGPYEVKFDWSDDYVNTFADQQTALIAGESIGATDAVDFRMFLFGESNEAAKARVDEIRQSKRANTSLAGIIGMGDMQQEGQQDEPR